MKGERFENPNACKGCDHCLGVRPLTDKLKEIKAKRVIRIKSPLKR